MVQRELLATFHAHEHGVLAEGRVRFLKLLGDSGGMMIVSCHVDPDPSNPMKYRLLADIFRASPPRDSMAAWLLGDWNVADEGDARAHVGDLPASAFQPDPIAKRFAQIFNEFVGLR